jgi:hypothetical protein
MFVGSQITELIQDIKSEDLLYRVILSPSRTSELGCATTNTDTAERSISIGREYLQVFLCTRKCGILAGFTARGSTCKVGERLGMSLPLLTCSPST